MPDNNCAATGLADVSPAEDAMTTLARTKTASTQVEAVRQGNQPVAPAGLVRIFGQAATRRERNRQEAYRERLTGLGALARFNYPHC